jgi:N-acetylmuramoyl-L-alanine amidase
MKQIILILSLICIFFINTNAQNKALSISDIVNETLKKEADHIAKISFEFKADSAVVFDKTVSIFFNTNQSYIKSSLPADFIEQLPELLQFLTDLTGTETVKILAKEKGTNVWQSIEYFANHPEILKYEKPASADPNYVDKNGNNNTVVSRVFPGGTNSPTTTGPLAGKTVWLSPGHGWHNTGSGFVTQRGTSNEMVEDFTTIESINNYLMYYLINAGANVWSVRERDVNTNEVIIDNDVPTSGYAETGTWADGSVAGYGGSYRVATSSATETATASYTATIPQSGWYWVSVRCIAGANRATDAQFTIIHSGDTSVVKINQEIHSDTWVYAGQYYFTVDSLNKIIISNTSTESGQAIIADAVRLGGGIGATADCTSGGNASGKARSDESAKQYSQFQKFNSCVEDVTVRPRYAEYELAKGTPSEISNAVFVSLHTNAFNASANGTETYSYDGTSASQPFITAGSVDLKNYVHNQVVGDIQSAWKPTWVNRGPKVANFGELRPLLSIPGILLELAFHDAAVDATELKKPEFRRFAARAIYKGIVKFFNNRDGTALAILPEQPNNIAAKNIGSNNIQLTWTAPLSGGVNGDAATGYKIYVSKNGKSFKDGIPVTTNNYTFSGEPKTTYYFKISATNAGGESFASSVVAARTPKVGSTAVPYLIVDGFDRLDASALIPVVESAALGTVKRMKLDRMNRYDYMIEHATAIGTCNNIAFDGCQNETVIAGIIVLGNYAGVDWITGEESTVDKSLDVAERALLKTYLNAGGSLFISGSEIGWDIGRAASANVDLDFYNNYLKANFIGDGAGTYNFNGTTTLFTGQSATFDNSTNGYYNVDFADRLAVNGGSSIALNYNGGTADGAAVAYDGVFNVIYLGFPFEAITSAAARNNLMCNAIAFLTPNAVVPIIGLVLEGYNKNTLNIIKWKTVAEINTQYMIIERSENGILFTEISNKFLPKGNAITGAEYFFTDNSILQNGFYRIKVVDIDGKISYSNKILLKAPQNEKLFLVINNPATNEIKISLQKNTDAQIRLSNSLGQTLYEKNIKSTTAFVHSINVNNYAKGIYLLTVFNKTTRQVEKIVIQ